jgi:hypothetical protein
MDLQPPVVAFEIKSKLMVSSTMQVWSSFNGGLEPMAKWKIDVSFRVLIGFANLWEILKALIWDNMILLWACKSTSKLICTKLMKVKKSEYSTISCKCNFDLIYNPTLRYSAHVQELWFGSWFMKIGSKLQKLFTKKWNVSGRRRFELRNRPSPKHHFLAWWQFTSFDLFHMKSWLVCISNIDLEFVIDGM